MDNSSCLDLIHGKPTGLFQLLDEESGYVAINSTSANLFKQKARFHAGLGLKFSFILVLACL